MTDGDLKPHIRLRHYAYFEGYDAANIGYTGRNPYVGDSSQAVTANNQWTKGYIAAVRDRLTNGTSALGPKP
jgi:hypothetical protein